MFNFFTSFYRSPKWSTARKEHLKYQPECQACGRSKDVEVHHIEPFHINPSRELDPTNLITLCAKTCHLTFGHLMDYKSWNKDVVSDCANYKQKLQQRPYNDKFIQKPTNDSWFNNIINIFWWNN
jgi:5-methylcytosine-specific restriction protein A